MNCRVALAFAVLSMQSAANAQENDVKGAEAAFDEADALLAQGQPERACARYADSYRLDPQLGALLHVADCNERIDKLATAWRAFEDGYRLALQKRDERAAVARKRADALVPRLAYLRVSLPADAGDGAQILVDGAPVESPVLARGLPVDRGTHGIVVTSDGRERWRTEATVKGVPGVLYFHVPSWRAPAPAADGRDTSREWLGVDPSLRRALGWTALGLGAASAGLSAYFFVRQGNKADEAATVEGDYAACATGCDADATNAELSALAEQQRTARTWGIVTGITGAVFLTGGAVLLFAAPREDHRASRGPRLGIGAGAVTLRGEF